MVLVVYECMGALMAIGIDIDIDIDYTEYCNYGFAFGLELLFEIANSIGSRNRFTYCIYTYPTDLYYTCNRDGKSSGLSKAIRPHNVVYYSSLLFRFLGSSHPGAKNTIESLTST
jgi:hypothetical protein